jgi:transposase
MRTETTPQSLLPEPVLCVAFELSLKGWKMAFSTGLGQSPRLRGVPARDLGRARTEIERAKAKFGLPANTRVVSCYEAGRDGFWLHRALVAMGVENVVVDSASIEVDRRKRRAKTDRIDAGKLVILLLRYSYGEKKALKVVRVPTQEEEDRRHLHRELKTAREDRTSLTNRIKGFLANHGLSLQDIRELPQRLGTLRQWNGEPLPPRLMERIRREWKKVEEINEQIREIEAERRKLLRSAEDAATACTRKLLDLRAIGENAAWLFSLEFFSWRDFQNVRQIGSLAGLSPSPYQSGDERRELGISKAGNRWIRGLAIEIAWGWLRYQPQSELSRWYHRRFGGGSSRVRRIGIVALARKLLVEIWKYLQTGTPPAGAVLKSQLAR